MNESVDESLSASLTEGRPGGTMKTVEEEESNHSSTFTSEVPREHSSTGSGTYATSPTQCTPGRGAERTQMQSMQASSQVSSGRDPRQPLKARIVTGALSKNRRSLLLIRTAERVDRVFPDWVARCFADDGTYEPYDLNFPARLPIRPHGPAGFHNDAPITSLGAITGNLLGRALRHRHHTPAFILASPSLRAIQTAVAVCAEIGAHPVICIEPGLFEPMGWYRSLPPFMPPDALRRCGYTVSLNYKSVVSTRDLELLAGRESDVEAAARITQTLNTILGAAKVQIPTPNALILVVAHAFTLDSALRSLETGGSRIPALGRGFLGLAYPYTTLLTLQEHNDVGDWSLVRRQPLPIPPLHYTHFASTPLPLLTDPSNPPTLV